MTPERRARQAQIMRERWATRRPEMEAILATAQAGRVASGRSGWQAYHARAGHDGGLSAALADGAHDGPYAVVRTLDYWEALYEPPWDIGWGDRGPAARPPQLPADAILERHHAAHRSGRHWTGWVIRRPDDPPDTSCEDEVAARYQQRPPAPRAAAVAQAPQRQPSPPPPSPPPPAYTCSGCQQPSWLYGPPPPAGTYQVRCRDCGALTPIEIRYGN